MPPELGTEEELLVVLRGIGAVLFLTNLRLIVVRDGVERRPRTGIHSIPLEDVVDLRVELGTGPSGRIAVATTTGSGAGAAPGTTAASSSPAGQEAVSMFFDARSLDRAHHLIDLARPLIALGRRGSRQGPGRRPGTPGDSGPPDPT